jgi:hypothetical protein
MISLYAGEILKDRKWNGFDGTAVQNDRWLNRRFCLRRMDVAWRMPS